MGVTLWVLLVANAAVIGGVILEEDEKIARFIALRREFGWFGAVSRLKKRGVKTIRETGFILLVCGLGVELLAQTVSEVDSNAALASANITAAAAIERTARVEQAAAWRRLTISQHNAMFLKLWGANVGTVVLDTVENDPEALVYCREILTAFRHAGVQVPPLKSSAKPLEYDCLPHFTFGIGLGIEPGKQPGRAVVKSAFEKAGLSLEEDDANDPSIPAGTIVIIVGSKPPPPDK